MKKIFLFLLIGLVSLGGLFFLFKDSEWMNEALYTIKTSIGLEKAAPEMEVLKKEDMIKFSRSMVFQQNTLYTAKTDKEVQHLSKEMFRTPKDHEEKVKTIFEFSRKNQITQSVVSVVEGSEKVDRKHNRIIYTGDIVRFFLFENGQRFTETSTVYLSLEFESDTGGYKIKDFVTDSVKMEKQQE